MRGLFSHDTDFDNFILFIRYIPNVNAMSIEHFSRSAKMVRGSVAEEFIDLLLGIEPSDFNWAENSDGFRICDDRCWG